MKKFLKTTIVLWFVLIAVIFCTCEEDDGPVYTPITPNYNMTGTYKFTKPGGDCRWDFTEYGNYQASGYGISETKTGTWSSSGNDVTISFESGAISGYEVFTVQESGSQRILTLKDSSAQASNVLASLGLAAKSVTLTKIDTPVTFSGVTANGSATQTTTQLTLTFSQAITGLSADDITLSGVSGVTKGTLSGSGPAYTLPISGFNSGGNLSVAVAKSGYAISGSPKTVTIYSFDFVSVTANGSYPQSTTQLTLTFSRSITGLSADDITLSGVSGVTKGTLSSSESYYSYTYTLPISGFSEGGSLSVSVSKSGYTISGSPKTVTIYYYSVSDSVSIEMVQITAGTFTMGSPTSETYRSSVETQHPVTLSGFYMSKYQVTQEQYYAVMGTNPSYFHGGSEREPAAGENQGKRPVEYVNWYDAVEFCNKLSVKEGLQEVYTISERTPATGSITSATVTADFTKSGYRLPTEAEWEYACRAGTTTAYNTGGTISDNTGWYSSNSGKTHEVGLKSANAWGLYDMHGNVYEWCWDWYGSDYYSSSPTDDPTGPESGTNRVLRGGYWYSSAQYLRSAYRGNSSPRDRGGDLRDMYGGIGFRLVRSE